jgi:predicted dehydrogenase
MDVAQRSLPAQRTPDPPAAPAIRWGILAPGWIAQQFAAALRRGTRQQIVAIGSRNLDRARAFADEFGATAAYGSYQELVNDPQVDIVYVASPHSEHRRQARLALEAGKPVLVEKAPMAGEEDGTSLNRKCTWVSCDGFPEPPVARSPEEGPRREGS